MEKQNSDKDKKDIRQENEELRKQIQDEYGGKTWINPDSNLPPELENEFLTHIMEFEKAFENRVTTTVYEFLGKPNYRKIEKLSDDEISVELNKLYDIMEENQVRLSTICQVSDRELYRFITEELFFEEKDDIRIPGMTSSFIYEEFHPNHDYDIRQHIEMFTLSYFDDKSDFYKSFLTSSAEKQNWHNDFQATFSGFKTTKFEITEVNFDLKTEQGNAVFDCNIMADVENSNDKFLFKGKGNIDLKLVYDYWCIDSFELPKPIKVS